MVDGAGYLVIRDKEAGQPVEVVYPAEGTPLVTGPSAVFKAAPNPNAARLFQNWMHVARGPAASRRSRAPVFAARAGGREARRPQALRHQADEGGSRPASRSRAERDQGALREVIGVEGREMTRAADARRRPTLAAWRVTSIFAWPACLHRLRRSFLGLRWCCAAHRAADVVAGLLQLHRQGRRVHARQLRHAGHRPDLLDPLVTTVILATSSASSAAWSRRRWAGWWRAPTCRCAARCAPW